MIKSIKCTNPRYIVEFFERHDGRITATAFIDNNDSYNGLSYWLKIGTYKGMKSAIRFAQKKLAAYNLELNLA